MVESVSFEGKNFVNGERMKCHIAPALNIALRYVIAAWLFMRNHIMDKFLYFLYF